MSESKLNKEIVTKILNYLSSGELFTNIFKKEDVSINPSTYYDWKRASASLQEMHDDAVALGVEFRVEAIEDKIETAESDLEFRKATEVGKHRRWHAKALNKAKYGDNQKVEHTGKDGEVLQIIITDHID